MADPLHWLCRRFDSFSSARVTPPDITYFQLEPVDRIILTADFTTRRELLVNPVALTTFHDLQREIMEIEPQALWAGKNWAWHRDQVIRRVNPFEQIGRSLGHERTFVKLADLDVMVGLSGEVYTLERMTVPDRAFTYCDVAGGPGGFSHYLQWRFPRAHGWGMTLTSESSESPSGLPPQRLDWDPTVVDFRRFTAVAAPRGDITVEYPAFITRVLSDTAYDGVDLVLGDGGFDVLDFTREEEEHYALIAAQIYIALHTCAGGGSIAIKIKHSHTLFTAQLLYLAALHFERVTIVKPALSRPANAERYFVAHGRRTVTAPAGNGAEATTSPTLVDFSAVLRLYLEAGAPLDVSSLFAEDLPFLWQDWLWDSNAFFLCEQSRALDEIGRGMSDPSLQSGQDYNLVRALLILAVPEQANALQPQPVADQNQGQNPGGGSALARNPKPGPRQLNSAVHRGHRRDGR